MSQEQISSRGILMFYTEEDIQPAVDAAIEVFGITGNMIHDNNAIIDVVVWTPEFGKLWYGDVPGPLDNLKEKCNILSQKIGKPVNIDLF